MQAGQFHSQTRSASSEFLSFSQNDVDTKNTSCSKNMPTLKRNPDLRYLEQWDLSTLMTENVDIPNSQANINIPLVDFAISKSLHFSLAATYSSGEEKTNGLLGNGWSLQFPDDYIVLDQKETAFPTEFEYYLMINSQAEKLKRKKSTDHLQRFQIEDDKGIRITYSPTNEQWIIDGKNVIAVYGRAPELGIEAVHRSLFWDYWRGPGKGDLDSLKSQVQAWYVISREEKHSHKRKLFYEYITEEGTLSNGMNYTSMIQLKSIRDTTNSTRLDLLYGTKQRDEFVVQSPVNFESYLQFPIFLQSNKYLTGYELVTDSFAQKLEFVYTVRNEKIRKLTSITQLYTALGLSETLFQFEYHNEHHSLSEFQRGSDKSVKFSYAQLQIPLLNFGPEKNVVSHLTTENAQISISSDFAVMAYHLNTNTVYISVMNKQLTSVETKLEASDGTASDPSKYIQSFALLTFPNLIAIFAETETGRFLSTFHRNIDTNQWSESQQKTDFKKGDLFRYSEDIMAVAKNDTAQLVVFEPDDDSEDTDGVVTRTIVLPNGSLHRLIIQGRVILAYDGNYLFTITKDVVNEEEWHQNPTVLAYPSREEELHRDVYMDVEFAKAFKEQVRISGLQMINNMILLSVVKWLDYKLSCKVKLILIDEKYEMKLSQEFFTGDEKVDKWITDFVQEQRSEDVNGTNILKFRYEWVDDGRFQAKLFHISGLIDEQIDEMCKKDCPEGFREEFKKNHTDAFNKDGEEQLRSMVLFESTPCLDFQLDSKLAKTNATLIYMQGSSWLQEEKDDGYGDRDPITNMSLGKDFVLEGKQGRNSTDYKLFKQSLEDGSKVGAPLKEFRTSTNGSVALGFPSYLAFQEEPWIPAIVLPLLNNGTIGTEILLGSGEKLMQMSNAEVILTMQELEDPSLNPYTNQILSRRVNSVVQSAPTLVISRSEVNDNGFVRVRTYENSFVSNKVNLTQENTVCVIPTGNLKYSGKYVETTIIPVDNPYNATKVTKWIDSEGNLVRSNVVEFPDRDEPEADKPDYKIFDVSEDLEISAIYPYNVTNQMVAYIGFEVYESQIISGTNTTWNFPVDAVVRNGDALTGESFLKLHEGQMLETSLTPTDQSTTYVASCWVRCEPEEKFEFEAPVPYFKANLEISEGNSFLGIYGQMKRLVGEWLYIEVTADFHRIRSNVYEEYYRLHQQETLPLPSKVNFTIGLQIDPNRHSSKVVDIDHVRFMPISADLNVKVYDEKNGNEIATVLPNGAIARKVYNAYGQEIVNVDEDGQIEQLMSTSHSGQIFPIPKRSGRGLSGMGMKSDLIIMPEWGSYEKLNLYSFSSQKWFTSSLTAWEMKNWRISHVDPNGTNEIRAVQVSKIFEKDSAAFRLYFILDSVADSKLEFSIQGGPLFELKTDIENQFMAKLALLLSLETFSNLPTLGELIVYIDHSTLWVFIDGDLLVEKNLNLSSPFPWSQFSMKASGLVTISDFMILNNPQIFYEFRNGFGDRTQIIQLESENSILVSENIYDEIGREAIKTKTGRVTRNSGETLFTFQENFAINKNPDDINSVFHTGILEGLVNDLNPEDEGYCYTRTIFFKDLLRESEVDGLPGRDFSADSSFKKTFSRHSGIPFMTNLFPKDRGYMEKVMHEPNGSIKVSIVDKKEQEVAQYVRVPGFDDILTTFEYDSQGNLVKILPPAYHEQVNTFARTSPLPIGNEGLTEDEVHWQKVLCTHFTFDESNFLTKKFTPDTGIQGYSYDFVGNMRFMYTLDPESNLAKNIVSFLHVSYDQPVEIGFVPGEMQVGDLLKYENSTSIPGQILHQRIVYSDFHSDPNVRDRLKLFMTYTSDSVFGLAPSENVPPPHQELVKFDSGNNVVLKTNNAVHSDFLTNLHKHYKGGKLSEIQYPRDGTKSVALNLMHSHDKLKHLVGLGTRDNPTSFANFSYSTSGQLSEELLEQGSTSEFNRVYKYNSPGFLVEIGDPFLSQNVAFIEKGYGQAGFGDGIIMNTAFNASWPESRVDSENLLNWFKIPEEDFVDKTKKMCLSALKRLGFVDESTLVPRLFLSHADLSLLPMSCSGAVGHDLMKVIATKLPPGRFYGHRYAYGNHEELQKAKYFSTEEEQMDPLQIYTFHKEIPEVETEQASEQIWDILAEHDFIITDNRRTEDKTAAIAKEGTVEIFCYQRLDSDLQEIKPTAFVYTRPIIYLLYNIIIKNEAMIDLNNFKETYVVWLGYRDTPTADFIINLAKQDAGKIYEMLTSKGYLSGEISSILSENFMEKLSAYRNILPQIVNVLQSHFSTQIGRSVNDYEAYSIDANGNQKMFYVGLERHNLEYVNGTNRVSKLSVLDPYALPGENLKVFELDHDPVGNVSKAPHRNIEEIRYHPVINRPVYIGLSDGRKIIIQYDAQGERILKRVYDKKDVLLSEVKYFRDENGQVMMDTRTKFPQQPGESVKVTTSTYLHGPRGLLGFIRNGKFYSVFTDHAGSIRLVTQGGLVVAGYDYWPYGELMKAYGEEDAHIHYRFTGQEWDEETGLYNFHARIYDPTLGRFFQPDPKAQYYSPYIYAGNSPISKVDPDGEFFLEIAIIVGIVVGAYLGGAAANGKWNPLKWDWKNLKTYMGILGGGIAGGMLPGGIVAMVGSIGIPGAILVGLGGSYLSMAKVNKSWNPAKWDWTSPGTYNAFFTGFGDGVSGGGLFGGFNAVRGIQKYAKTLTSTGQIFFFASSYGIGATLGYVNGALANGKNFKFWEWDFKNPSTLAAIQAGFMIGSGLPKQATKIFKNFAWIINKKSGSELFKEIWKNNSLLEFLKDIRTPLYLAVVKGVLNYVNIVVSQCFYDHCSFNPAKWDWQSMSTYEGVLNAILKSPPAYKMVKAYRMGAFKLPDNLWLGKLGSKKFQTSSHVTFIFKHLDVLSKFYFFYPSGRNLKSNSDNLLPIAFEMLTRFFETKEESYVDEVKQLLKGLSSGSKIYPDSSFGEYLDCTPQNSTREYFKTGHFEECDIASGAGKRSRQNREIIHNLFIPTQKYQNKDDFIQVEEKSEVSDEFLEYFLHTIQSTSNQPSEFYYEFFIGATYNSLLNFLREQYGSEKKVFLRLENNPELGKQVLHLAFLKDSTLSVRVVVVGSQIDFNTLANHIKTQKYLCQLESSVGQQISKIEAQIYLIETATSPKLFTMAPEVSLDMQGCSGNPKFVEAPAVAGQQILKDFETFLEIGGIAEEKFKTFFEGVASVYNNMVQLIGQEANQSFMGFLYGLLDTNMKNTYSLQLEASVADHLAILSTVNGNGMETWLSPPVIISFDPNQPDIERFLYSFSSRTLANEAIVTDVENGLASFTSVKIPQFQGFYENSVSSGNLQILENSIKYLFYHHKEKVMAFGENSAPTGNLHYVSNFILGEFLAHANFKEGNSTEIFVFSPQSGSQFQQRLSAQRIIFIINKDTESCAVLNLIESSRNADPIFDPTVPTDIPVLPATVLSNIRHLKIKLNTNTLGSFSGTASSFFQGIEELVENPASIPVDPTSYYGLIYETEFSPKKLSFERDSVHKFFSMLSENRYKALVQSDIDFLSLVSGLFTAMANLASVDADGLTTTLRTRSPNQDSLSLEKHSLLTLTKDNSVVPDGEQVLVQNLKFANTGDDDLAKYNEASNELKQHVCSNKQSFSEFWRVAVVPAVFGPEIENAMRFDTNPTSVINDNCTTSMPSNIWYDILERNRSPGHNAKSTATKASLSILPFNIIRFFSEGISRYFNIKSKPSLDNKGESKSLNENVSNCQPGAWLDGLYSENGITCLTEISKMMVFRRIYENDIGKLGATGFAHQAIGDTYDKSSCSPLEFNGMPSVTCKGEKTNLVYTPYLQERIFDNVDGNIMLARMVIYFGGKLLGIPKVEGNQNHEEYDVTVSDDMIDILQRRLKKVDILLENASKMNIGEVEWARMQLQDCEESICELKQMEVATVGISELKLIQERLTALYEDLSEHIEWVVRERSSDQNNAATDKKAEYKMSEQNTFIPSSGSLNDYIANRVFSRGNLLNNAHETASHM